MELIRCNPDDEIFGSLTKALYSEVPYRPVAGPSTERLHTCYVVTNNGEPQCRAALFTAQGLSIEGKTYAMLGSFEALDRPEAVAFLTKAVLDEVKEFGWSGIIGPMNGSTWHSYRFNLHQELFFSEAYHPGYYPRLWEGAGFQQLAGYYSSLAENLQELDAPEPRFQEGIALRNIDMGKYESELKAVHQFSMKAFSGNFLFTPISQEEFLEIYRPLKDLVDPEMVFLAEDRGQLVGVLFGFPDHYDPGTGRVIAKTVARIPGDRYKGLGGGMSAAFVKRVQAMGYRSLIHAFMLDEGHAKGLSNDFHGQPYRKYVLYKQDC